jgi:hypothetical protein
MKKINSTRNAILALLFVLLAFPALAQSPDAFNYQAAVRDANGQILANQNVSFQLSILLGGPSGSSVYSETHSLTTNQFGLANLKVGDGTPVSGTFSAIDWANGSHFLQVELDETGGSNYTLMGATELVSVPYALHARTVEIDAVDDADADPANELQTITASGSAVTLSNGGGSFSIDDADADPSNELQTITASGSTVTLSNGGGAFSIDDADADPSNEFNTGLSMNADTLTLTDGGGTLQVDLSGLVDDGDWNRSGDIVYNNTDTIMIGTNTGDAFFSVGRPHNFFEASHLDSLPNQMWIGGDVNTNGQTSNVTKLMIGHYDNDGSTVYPIACKDENGNTDFYLKNRPSANGDPLAYFAGNVGIGTMDPGYDLAVYGVSAVVNDSGDHKISSSVSATYGHGYTNYFGPNARNIYFGAAGSSNLDDGAIAVFNSSEVSKAGIRVNTSGQGEIWGDVKNFRMDHPTQQGKEIWYASLEGPEAAAYVRGTGKIVNGQGTVEFPEHFELVANPSTMTVTLTPLSGQSKGLAVIEKTAQGFKVVELMAGSGSYEFDWEAKAVRKGYENYRVIRDASEMEAGDADRGSIQHELVLPADEEK